MILKWRKLILLFQKDVQLLHGRWFEVKAWEGVILSFLTEVIVELKSERWVRVACSFIIESLGKDNIKYQFLGKWVAIMSYYEWFSFCSRRSCVGSELVDWLLEHCPFVQCRSMAIGVWQLLLDMGIMLSGQYYMFCEAQKCYFIKLPEQNLLAFLEAATIWMEIVSTGKYLRSLTFYKQKWPVIFWLLILTPFVKISRYLLIHRLLCLSVFPLPSPLLKSPLTNFFFISDIVSCSKCLIYLAVLKIIIRNWFYEWNVMPF